jgi:hypothetical protein
VINRGILRNLFSRKPKTTSICTDAKFQTRNLFWIGKATEILIVLFFFPFQERERDHFSQFMTEGFMSYCKRKRRDKVSYWIHGMLCLHFVSNSFLTYLVVSFAQNYLNIRMPLNFVYYIWLSSWQALFTCSNIVLLYTITKIFWRLLFCVCSLYFMCFYIERHALLLTSRPIPRHILVFLTTLKCMHSQQLPCKFKNRERLHGKVAIWSYLTLKDVFWFVTLFSRYMAIILSSRHLLRCTIVQFTYIPTVQVILLYHFNQAIYSIISLTSQSHICLLLLQSPLIFFMEIIALMFLQLG